MTVEELEAAFEAAGERPYTGIFACDGRFGTNRNDLHALILLDRLLPAKPRQHIPSLICHAEHDQIWFDVDLEELAKVITPAEIEELDSCCVFVDDNGLSMFR